jgi:Glu-tRNA(Gln) amidotransferase subunit E-like FAD-binding protein
MKKAKLEEGLASYMYENFLESHTLFISAKVVDSPCHSQKEKSISLRINIEQVLNKRLFNTMQYLSKLVYEVINVQLEWRETHYISPI